MAPLMAEQRTRPHPPQALFFASTPEPPCKPRTLIDCKPPLLLRRIPLGFETAFFHGTRPPLFFFSHKAVHWVHPDSEVQCTQSSEGKLPARAVPGQGTYFKGSFP